MTLKIPTTNPHRLSAKRVARVTIALVRKLMQKGVLPPPPLTLRNQRSSTPEGEKRHREESPQISMPATGALIFLYLGWKYYSE
jgi:hypothetical protein